MKRLLLTISLVLALVGSASAQGFQSKILSGTTCPGAGCLNVDVGGAGSIGIQITGTFSGTLQFEQTVDATTFTTWGVYANGSLTAVTSATAAGLWTGPTNGRRQVRVRFSAFTSGTAIVNTIGSSARLNIGGTGSVPAYPLVDPSFTGAMSGPTGTCAAPPITASGQTTTGLALTTTPSVDQCVDALTKLRTIGTSTTSQLQWFSNVSHGVTAIAPTNVPGYIGGDGGLAIVGLNDATSIAAGTAPIRFVAINYDSTATTPAMRIGGFRKAGTGLQPLADTQPILELTGFDSFTTTKKFQFFQSGVFNAIGSLRISNQTVTQGATDVLPASSFGAVQAHSSSNLGTEFIGISNTDATAVTLAGISGDADGTVTVAPVEIDTYRRNGTGVLPVSTGPLLDWKNFSTAYFRASAATSAPVYTFDFTVSGSTNTIKVGSATISDNSSTLTLGNGNVVVLSKPSNDLLELASGDSFNISNGELQTAGARVGFNLSAYGVGTAYSLTNTAAAIDFGTTDPAIVLSRAGTYQLCGQVQLTYTGATVVAETATIKVRRTNNTAADLSPVVVLDLPVSTTLTNTYGIFPIPCVFYTTAVTNDAVTIFANVSAALGAGTIDATATGTSITAVRLY